MMEEMAPAVLWFDEIEMGLKTTETGGEQGRIFGFFLTWMQEKTRGLFVAATANRIESAARRNDPQRPLRRSLFRRSAARRGDDRNLPHSPACAAAWTCRNSICRN